jgi:hypothetical protein
MGGVLWGGGWAQDPFLLRVSDCARADSSMRIAGGVFMEGETVGLVH